MKTFQAKARQFLLNEKSVRATILFSFGLLAIITVLTIADGAASSAGTQAPQTAITGEWTADFDRNQTSEIHFTLQRRSQKGSFNMRSENLPLGELQGLSAEVLTSTKTNVNFRIVREAGTFSCEGFFNEGRGAGVWTLVPSEKFISQMRSRNYDNLTEDNLISAALNNLTIKFIDYLKVAGYDNLTFEEVRRARTHNVDADYVKQAKSLGFERQTMETLIRMRNHEITPEFVNQMKSVGYDNLSIEELIRLKNHNVTAEFINELKTEGYSDIPVEAAVRLKNHGVDQNFIRRAKSQGYTNATLEELVSLRKKEIVK